MTFKFVLAAALVTATAFSAQAKNREKQQDPSGLLYRVDKTDFISVFESGYDGNMAARMIRRSSLNESQSNARVIAVVRGGEATTNNDFPKSRGLGDDVLEVLASNKACDLSLNGPCLVYSKAGRGHVIVVGTRRVGRDVQILQGGFASDGPGADGNNALTRNLNQRNKAKYLVFTKVTLEENQDAVELARGDEPARALRYDVEGSRRRSRSNK